LHVRHGYPYPWVNQMTRALNMNRERRRTLGVFEQVSQVVQETITSGNSDHGSVVPAAQRHRLVHTLTPAFAVSPAIVFGYMRYNQWRLLDALMECTDC
jgi:hypothetical protein